MPNVLVDLQGSQKLVCKDVPVIGKNGGERKEMKQEIQSLKKNVVI